MTSPPFSTKSGLAEQLSQAVAESRLYFSRYQSLSKDSLVQICAQGRDGLTKYDEELARLRTALQKVSEDRRQLARYVDVCESHLAPVRRLPTEVMIEIFLSASDCSEDGSKVIHKIPKDNPLHLTLSLASVCVGWREIVIRTPELWSSLSIDFDRLREDVDKVLDTVLARSKGRSLTLWLHGRFDPDVGDTSKVLELLVREIPRWRHIYFGLKEKDAAARIQGTLKRTFKDPIFCLLPTLESLHLNIHIWDHDKLLSDTKMFRKAPNLRYLELEGGLLEFDDDGEDGDAEDDEDHFGQSSVIGPTIPSPLIKTLRVGDTGAYYIIDYLCRKEFTQIQELFLADIDTDDYWSPDGCIPTLEQLSSLSIVQDSSEFMGDILTCFSRGNLMPSLKSLRLKVTDPRDPEMDPPFGRPLRRFIESTHSAASLTSLHLEGLVKVAPILKCLPNLEELTVFEDPETTEFDLRPATDFEALFKALHVCEHRKGSVVVPKLRSLTLTCDLLPGAEVIFVSMVSSRWNPSPDTSQDWPGRYLRSVSLQLHKSTLEKFIQTQYFRKLKELADEGLQVSCDEYQRAVDSSGSEDNSDEVDEDHESLDSDVLAWMQGSG
ncbi:hypothetical protein D9758_011596 [Tetrapyrgos nigripes]|uniref:F-box domain-containing protein n=1 Tax=Tetrapyrgos nigripes TaxID=182062 RepID=A0A8H5CQP2_9AGAR|nr:hypothetical protein D9758_011596 [Tetrapyrgos nigripes]